MHLWGQRSLVWVASLLPPCKSWGSNSAWWEAPLLNEPSHWAKVFFFFLSWTVHKCQRKTMWVLWPHSPGWSRHATCVVFPDSSHDAVMKLAWRHLFEGTWWGGRAEHQGVCSLSGSWRCGEKCGRWKQPPEGLSENSQSMESWLATWLLSPLSTRVIAWA